MEEVFADLHVHIGRSENGKPIKITAAIAIPAINLLSKTHHQIRLFLIKYINILI